MAISQLVKQSRETFSIYGGIANVYATGEEIITHASTEVLCEDKDGTDVAASLLQGSPSISTDKLKLYQRIKAAGGSEAQSPYKITFLMWTNQSNLYEKDVFLYIKDR
jgi:hypothetical protein